MPANETWSASEVETCVADYLYMMALEFNGQKYNKAERARTLAANLNGRTDKAVKYKWHNISAVMLELGYPHHPGYKPAKNYHRILVDEVSKQLLTNESLRAAVEDIVSRPAVVPPVGAIPGDIVWRAVSPPAPTTISHGFHDTPTFSAAKRDYFAIEARNRSLGEAGEKHVVEMEIRRLWEAGQQKLSNRVEHVSQTAGDGLGYDIHSFEVDGRERLIEVKTTSFEIRTPFYVSRNELDRSRADSDIYHLYRVFEFREEPKHFILSGHISDHCQLNAETYLARVD